MSLLEYARVELARLGDDAMQKQMSQDLLELVGVFAGQDHSGSSAIYAIDALKRLLRCQPLTPLTGEDSEWIKQGDDLFQNKRCPSVFKDSLGHVQDSNKPPGRVVNFPYMP